MNTKHTPGPWKASRAIRIGFTISSDQILIVGTSDEEGRYGSVEHEADARLIAAAPTLLKLVIDVYTDAHSGHELNFLTQQLLEKTLHEIDPELLQEAETLKKANRAEYERIRFMDDDEE